jgi:prophage DNA circulation protein
MTAFANSDGGIGSFRGVPFSVLSVSQTGGRRTTTHEFYAAQQTITEDNGLAPRRFDVSAVIVGDDFTQRRDDIIEALDEVGPGTLVLPLFGNITVQTDGTYTINETTGALRSVQLSMRFVEDFSVVDVVGVAAVDDQIVADAEAIDGALQAAVDAAFSAAEEIQAVVDDAVTTIQDAASALRKINGRIRSALGVFADVSQAIDAISNAAATLISTPAQFVSEMQAVITSIFRAIDTIETAAKSSLAALTGTGPAAIGRTASRLKQRAIADLARIALLYGDTSRGEEHKAVFGFVAQEASGTGDTLETTQQNIRTIDIAIKTAIAKEVAQSATVLDFEASQDVEDFQDDVVALFDNVLADCDDELYRTMSKLKSSFVMYSAQLQRTLPYAQIVTVEHITSSLALAHKYYGDISREPDISLGNNLPNPAAVMPGTRIRIIGEVV